MSGHRRARAARARENFRFLVGLGFTRFNLLPGYYLPWRPEQLSALEEGLAGIADDFRAAWAADHPAQWDATLGALPKVQAAEAAWRVTRLALEDHRGPG